MGVRVVPPAAELRCGHSLCFIKVTCYTGWLSHVGPPLHPWDKSRLVTMQNPRKVLLDSVARALWRVFAPLFVRNTGLYGPFPVVSLGLMSDNVGRLERVRGCSLLLHFSQEFGEDWC